MLEVKLSVTVASPLGKVWNVLGNFNGLPDWHPWVKESALEPAPGGVGRRVKIDGGAAGYRELTERLVRFDSSAHAYAYTITAGPVPFTDYEGSLRVVPDGAEKSVVEYIGRFRPALGKTETEAVERVRTFYEAGLNNLPVIFGR